MALICSNMNQVKYRTLISLYKLLPAVSHKIKIENGKHYNFDGFELPYYALLLGAGSYDWLYLCQAKEDSYRAYQIEKQGGRVQVFDRCFNLDYYMKVVGLNDFLFKAIEDYLIGL